MVDIENIIKKLLVKYPLWGSLLANVKFIPNYDIETACTDGYDIYYNPDFMGKYDICGQTFIMAHEASHIAQCHIPRLKGKDISLWNDATDAVINANLKKDGLFVEGFIDEEEAIDYSAEEYYEKLLKKKKEEKEKKNGSSENSKTKDNPSKEQNKKPIRDDHNSWKNQQVEKQQGKKEDINEKKMFEENRKEREKNLDRLRDTLAKESFSKTAKTDTNMRNIEIGSATNAVDLKHFLVDNTKANEDWTYQNATIENGIIMPHLEQMPYSNTEILLDTSGSIDDEVMRAFLKICKSLLEESTLKVGCFDTKFYGFTEINEEEDIDQMQFFGGGGTDFDVAVNALSEDIENKIIFTDGKADMPQKEVNALWVVFGSKKIEPKGGIVINIDKQELENFALVENNFINKRQK